MKVLGIETSCDETAVCIVEAEGGFEKPHFKILGDALYSQVKTHAEYGGVFPALAKREHAKNLPALLKKALEESGLHREVSGLRMSGQSSPARGVPQGTSPLRSKPEFLSDKLQKILEREPGLFDATKQILESIERPVIDAIAVTQGPGLEPALWVGINFARALGIAWDIPVIPSNHMEGHIVSPLLSKEGGGGVVFPALALLISGGHTELVLIKDWLSYEVIGRTKDDAVGEAFDKVARLLGLPYPGGPEISRLAEETRVAHTTPQVKLPRPMLKTPDYNFSFSGLKTAVLYKLNSLPDFTRITPQPPLKLRGGERGESRAGGDIKHEIALEFENAVTEVLIEKTRRALEEFNIKTLILGGGVVANKHIRDSFKKLVAGYADMKLLVPEISHSTDNAVMIAAAGYLNILSGAKHQAEIEARGNLSF